MNWGQAIQNVVGLRGSTDLDLARLNTDLEEEFAFHLSAVEHELQLRGRTPEEAKREARKRFGDQEIFKSQCLTIAMEDVIMLQRLHALATVILLAAVVVMGYQLYSGQQRNGRAMASMTSELAALQENLASNVEQLKFELSPLMQYQAAILDADSSDREKLRALRELRFADGEGRSHEVVAAMLDVARETSDPRVRADIYRQLDEMTDPILKDALLESLANDPNAEVREEAAESLGPFAADADVRAALQRAVDEDQVDRVRLQARESLTRSMDVAQLQKLATSPDSTAQQKLMALRKLRGAEDDGGDARTHDVIVAMIDLANATKDSRIRADIFRQLDGVTDPVLEDVLINALAGDSSAEVRSEAAETLGHYLSSPRVVEALKKAAEKDESTEVRNEASRSLGERRLIPVGWLAPIRQVSERLGIPHFTAWISAWM